MKFLRKNKVNSSSDKSLRYILLYKLFFIYFLSDSIAYVYLLDNGFQTFDFFLAASISSLAGFALEIPTGVYADKNGAKSSMLVATLSFLAANIIFIFMGNSFWLLIIASFLIGVFKNFLSGADAGYIYLLLKQSGLEHEYTKIKGNIDARLFYLTGVFSIFSGFFYEINHKLPYLLTSIFTGVSLLFLIQCEDVREKEKKEKKDANILQSSIAYIKSSKYLQWFLLFTMFMTFILNGIIQTYQMYFKEMEIPVVYFGVIYSVFYFVSGLSSKLAYRLKYLKATVFLKLILCLLLLTATSFLLTTRIVLLGVAVLVPRIIIGVYPVLIQQFINDCVTQNRITILSIREFAKQIPILFILPLFGYVLDRCGLTAGYYILTGCSALFVIVLLWLYYNRIRKENTYEHKARS